MFLWVWGLVCIRGCIFIFGFCFGKFKFIEESFRKKIEGFLKEVR